MPLFDHLLNQLLFEFILLKVRGLRAIGLVEFLVETLFEEWTKPLSHVESEKLLHFSHAPLVLKVGSQRL